MVAEQIPVISRRQRALSQALEHVNAVAQAHHDNLELRTIYGGLCHAFPVLVRSNGLCQTLAFIEAKAAGPGNRGQAYSLLRTHIEEALQLAPNALLPTVRRAPVADYMRLTRLVLETWIFYKRFAVSILKVHSSEAARESGAHG